MFSLNIMMSRFPTANCTTPSISSTYSGELGGKQSGKPPSHSRQSCESVARPKRNERDPSSPDKGSRPMGGKRGPPSTATSQRPG